MVPCLRIWFWLNFYGNEIHSIIRVRQQQVWEKPSLPHIPVMDLQCYFPKVYRLRDEYRDVRNK